ncbi:cysteine--tRNA ligase, partial [Planctomycetota bacterium]
ISEGRLQVLLEERQAARAGKDFALADRIRDELKELGYSIEDRPEGPRIVRM